MENCNSRTDEIYRLYQEIRALCRRHNDMIKPWGVVDANLRLKGEVYPNEQKPLFDKKEMERLRAIIRVEIKHKENQIRELMKQIMKETDSHFLPSK